MGVLVLKVNKMWGWSECWHGNQPRRFWDSHPGYLYLLGDLVSQATC